MGVGGRRLIIISLVDLVCVPNIVAGEHICARGHTHKHTRQHVIERIAAPSTFTF